MSLHKHIAPIRHCVVSIIAMLFPFAAYCQYFSSSDITDIAEELALEAEDNESVTSIFETLTELCENPVALNNTDENELSRLFFLSGYQIKSLLYHIQTTGRIASIYEIASIPGFDRQMAETMAPFITLDYTPAIKKPDWQSESITNVSFKPGEKENDAAGSPIKILSKYKLSAGNYQAGFTVEKDAGESFLTDKPKRPDFLTGYLSFKGDKKLRSLIIGDYSVKLGHGSNVNTGFGTSISLTGTSLMSGRDEIKPYTSTNENNFFRGIAAELAVGKINTTLFISHNQQDATISYSGVDGSSFVENLYKSGVHNSASSVEKRDALNETTFGANIYYNLDNFKIGASWTQNRFSMPFKPDTDDPAQLYSFTGDRNETYSVHYQASFQRVMLYGEASLNDIDKYAIIQGVNLHPTSRLTVNMLYRNYAAGYTTFHGRGPGSSTNTNNEEGFFGNINFELHKHLFVIAGADISRSHWLSYRKDFPSAKIRQEIKLKYEPSEKTIVELSYGYRYSEQNSNSERGMSLKGTSTSHTTKAVAKFKPTSNLTLSTRFQYKSIEETGSRGSALLQDMNYTFASTPLSIWFRFGIFNTTDWDSRLYIYENDMLYSFSVPAMSGIGSRSYLMLKYSFGRTADIRVKYAFLTSTRDGVSNETDELKIQFKIRF